MKNPTRINLASVRTAAEEFLESRQTEDDLELLKVKVHPYVTNGPTDEINKRSVNMINRRLGQGFGMSAAITSGQPAENEEHLGRHIGVTITIGEHTFNIDSAVL